MDNKRIQIEETLLKAGFQKNGQEDSLYIENLSNPESSKGLGCPWLVNRWELKKTRESWYTDNIEIRFDINSFRQAFYHFVKNQLPEVQVVDLEVDHNGFWIVTEYSKKPSSPINLNQVASERYKKGVFGFHMSFFVEGDTASLNFSNHFIFGHLNRDILQKLPSCVAQSMGFDLSKCRSSWFEISIDFKEILFDIPAIKANGRLYSHLYLRQLTKRFLKTFFTYQEGWRLSLSDPDHTEFGFVLPPIEIIESRELAQKFKDIETYVAHGLFSEAKQALAKHLIDNQDSIYLLRRYAFVSLMDGESVPDQILSAMLREEERNLLFLSVGVFTDLEKNDFQQALRRLSLLGEELSRQIENFESIRSFDYVFPEILGDGWKQIDTQRSFMCYERILERRGDDPDILLKLMELAKSDQDDATEASLTKRLLKLVKDRNQIASFYVRLSQIFENQDLAQSSNYAFKAWQATPFRSSVAYRASQLFVKEGKPEKAIRVLDETIRHIENQKVPSKVAHLELEIGQIWWDAFSRKDLAQERIKKAFSLLPDQFDFLQKLIDLCQKIDDRALEIQINEHRFDLSIRIQQKEEVFKSVAVLIPYYQSEMPNRQKLSKLYQNLVKNYLLDPEELFNIINLENNEIDWDQLFQSIERQINLDHKIDVKPYYIILGRLAHQKLGKQELAAKCYEKAVELGRLDEEIYDYLDHYYIQVNDSKRRTWLLKIQLDASIGDRRKEILSKLFDTVESGQGSEANQVALEIYKENQVQEPIKRRIRHYLSKNDLSSIDQLLEKTLNISPYRHLKIDWIDFVLESLNDSTSSERFHWLQKNLSRLESLHEEPLKVCQRAVRYLISNPDLSELAIYLDRMILLGEIPDINPEIVLNALRDGQTSKGIYLFHVAKKQEKSMVQYQNLQKALTILSKSERHQELVISIYALLSEVSALKINDLRSFYQYCEKSGQLPTLAISLIAQLNHITEANFDLDLFNFVINFINQHSEEEGRLAPKLLRALEKTEHFLKDRLQLEAFLAIKDRSSYFSSEFGIDFLSKEKNWDLSSNFKEVFTWFAENPANRDFIVRLSQERIGHLMEENDKKKLAYLVDFLRPYRVATPQSNWLVLEYFLSQGMALKCCEQWGEIILHVKDKNEIRNLMTETKFLMSGINQKLTIEDFVSYVIENNLDRGLRDEIRDELKLEYALSLFLSERLPKISQEILSDYFAKDPTESRTWIPLFFLYNTLENHEALYHHLIYVIPRVGYATDLLRAYPITLESLEKEFQRIARMLQLPDQIPNYNRAVAAPRVVESEAEKILKAQSFQSKVSGEGTQFNLIQLDDTSARSLIHDKTIETQGADLTSGFQLGIDDTDLKSTIPKTLPEISSHIPPPPSIKEITKVTPSLQSMGEAESFTNVDWRLITSSMLSDDGSAQKILNSKFLSMEEKHFALQAVSLIEGRLDLIENWRHRVWMSVDEYFYQPHQRPVSSGILLNGLKQPLAQVLLTIKPSLEKFFQSKFTLRGLAERLGVRIDEFIKERTELNLSEPFFLTSAIRFFRNDWVAKGFRFFHIPFVEDKVLFEFQQNVFYFNLDHYRSRPPADLFHALFQVYRELEIGFHQTLQLKVDREIFPLIKRVKEEIGTLDPKKHGQISTDDQLALGELSASEKEYIAVQISHIDKIEIKLIENVLMDLKSQVMLDSLYSHLDLIGLLSQEMKIDLIQDSQAREQILRSRAVRNLLVHSSKFTF